MLAKGTSFKNTHHPLSPISWSLRTSATILKYIKQIKIITVNTNIPASFPVLLHIITTPQRRILAIIGNISNFSTQYSDLEIRPEKLTYFFKNKFLFTLPIFIVACPSISADFMHIGSRYGRLQNLLYVRRITLYSQLIIHDVCKCFRTRFWDRNITRLKSSH